jgi:hypothetical protein
MQKFHHKDGLVEISLLLIKTPKYIQMELVIRIGLNNQ